MWKSHHPLVAPSPVAMLSGSCLSYDPGMTRYLHTMYRITDPQRSREFYEALGFEFRRELPIVRDGELEATNFFFGVPGQEEELELTSTTTAVATSWERAMATLRSGLTTSNLAGVRKGACLSAPRSR